MILRLLRRIMHGPPPLSCPIDGRRTVGLSTWCREHTDEIVQGRKSPALQAALEALARERGLRGGEK